MDYRPLTAGIIERIRERVGPGRVVTDRERLEELGKDAGAEARTPDLVVEPDSVEQVQALLRLPIKDERATHALLLLEIDGPSGSIERDMEAVGGICMACGAQDVLMAPDSRKRDRMWEIRRQVSLRIEEGWPVYIPEDVVVPIGSIADFVGLLPEFEREYGMTIYSFGHAGDGNIHLNITAGSRADMGRVEEGIRAILEKVLSMKGTISGEHGIGIAKKRFMPLEISPECIRLQREIKRLFDPRLILNPGKIFENETY